MDLIWGVFGAPMTYADILSTPLKVCGVSQFAMVIEFIYSASRDPLLRAVYICGLIRRLQNVGLAFATALRSVA